MGKYEELLMNVIGPFGPWQIRTCIIFMVSSPFLLIYFPVFPGLRPHHFCRPSGFGQNNWTLVQWSNLTAPALKPPPAKGQKFDGCKIYNLPAAVDLNSSFEEARMEMDEALKRGALTAQPCSNGWLYLSETAAYPDTLIAQFDLVCDRSQLHVWSTTIFMIGFLVGAILFGEIGDRFGRKPTGILTLILAIAATILTSFAPSIAVFMVGRFLVGALTQGHYVVVYTLLMEISGPKARDIFTTGSSTFISVLCLSWYTLLAYFISNWRWLHMACSACMLIVVLYFPFMPESPRWLITKGRFEDALKEIQKAIRLNQNGKECDLTVADLVEEKNDSVKPAQIIDLFRTTLMLRISLLLMLAWFSQSLSYYGASFYSVKLQGVSPYLAFTIPTLLKLLFLIAGCVLTRYLPRRPMLVAFMVIGAGCAAIVAVIHLLPGVSVWWRNWLAIAFMSVYLGLVVAAFALTYVYSSELFPTLLRSRGIGACSMASRFGATLSPLVVDLDRTVGYRWLPMTVTAIVGFAAGFAALLLPESKNQPMTETPKQHAMVYGKRSKLSSDSESSNERAEDTFTRI